MNRQETQDDQTARGITRRKVITAGGAALVGATLLGPLARTTLATVTTFCCLWLLYVSH